MVVHTLYYIVADNGLEMSAIRDIGRLIVSNTEQNKGHCAIDILAKTKNSILFMHIFKGLYFKELRFKDVNNFYALPLLDKFISRFNKLEEKIGAETHKILIMSGHNCGWYLHGKESSGYTNKEILYLDNLRKAIENNNVYLDALWIDSCFGANMEVTMEFNEIAKYFVASPEYMYWEGVCNINFCRHLSKIKTSEDVYKAVKELISDLIIRSASKKDPLSLSLIDNKKFAKVIEIVKNVTFLPEDFKKKNIIDKCSIWLRGCESGKCSPFECDIFYDLYNTMKTKLPDKEFEEFSKIYKDSLEYTQNGYFKGVLSNGMDISLGFTDINLVNQKNSVSAFKRLKAYEHTSKQRK